MFVGVIRALRELHKEETKFIQASDDQKVRPNLACSCIQLNARFCDFRQWRIL